MTLALTDLLSSTTFLPSSAVPSFRVDQNTISLPAGAIQQPLYGQYFPNAWNFGSLGYLIARALMHAFDDTGMQFNGNGSVGMYACTL